MLVLTKFNDWFKVGSAYRSSNWTNYFAAIGLANQATLQKSKTTPTSVMVTCEGMSFVVGETFASYTELEKIIKTYEVNKFVQVVHRDSRTLDTAIKRMPKREEGANEDECAIIASISCVHLVVKTAKTKGMV